MASVIRSKVNNLATADMVDAPSSEIDLPGEDSCEVEPTFTCFPRFPPGKPLAAHCMRDSAADINLEIRDMIWKQVREIPRHFQIDAGIVLKGDKIDSIVNCKHPIPPLLQVCAESRRPYLKHYELLRPIGPRRTIFIDIEIDTINLCMWRGDRDDIFLDVIFYNWGGRAWDTGNGEHAGKDGFVKNGFPVYNWVDMKIVRQRMHNPSPSHRRLDR